MDLAHLYQVTLGDRDSGLAVEVLSLSSRYGSLPNAGPAVVAEQLGLRSLIVLDGGAQVLERAIEAILLAKTPREARRHLRGMDVGSDDYLLYRQELRKGDWSDETRMLAEAPMVEQARTFAQAVVSADLIPIEASPLDLHSLLELLQHVTVKRPDISIGTAVGLVAAGYSPLVLVTVPLGIILVGAAIDSAKPGRIGLVQRLRSFSGLHPKRPGLGDQPEKSSAK